MFISSRLYPSARLGVANVEELPNSHHVLCAWVCGREAMDMELCSDVEVVESLTRVLRQFTGDLTLPYPANILRSKWSLDQYFAGAYSYMAIDSTVGHQCDLANPLPGIFLTSYSYTDVSWGNAHKLMKKIYNTCTYSHRVYTIRVISLDVNIIFILHHTRIILNIK